MPPPRTKSQQLEHERVVRDAMVEYRRLDLADDADNNNTSGSNERSGAPNETLHTDARGNTAKNCRFHINAVVPKRGKPHNLAEGTTILHHETTGLLRSTRQPQNERYRTVPTRVPPSPTHHRPIPSSRNAAHPGHRRTNVQPIPIHAHQRARHTHPTSVPEQPHRTPPTTTTTAQHRTGIHHDAATESTAAAAAARERRDEPPLAAERSTAAARDGGGDRGAESVVGVPASYSYAGGVQSGLWSVEERRFGVQFGDAAGAWAGGVSRWGAERIEDAGGGLWCSAEFDAALQSGSTFERGAAAAAGAAAVSWVSERSDDTSQPVPTACSEQPDRYIRFVSVYK